MVSTSSEVLRVMGVWVRRADAGLARTAARNAGQSRIELHRPTIDGARTLRDLSDLEHARMPADA